MHRHSMASPQTSVAPPLSAHDLLTDERWQLVQRIISSPPFQKGTRLRDLLQYVTEQTIRGHAHELTEQHIGNALFHKPSDYSPLEDSSVRVHARQLRLKLHEYFNEDGRNESLILEIPKGAYAPAFRTVAKTIPPPPADLAPKVIPVESWRGQAMVPWAICAALAVLCVALAYRTAVSGGLANTAVAAAGEPWPFSPLFEVGRH